MSRVMGPVASGLGTFLLVVALITRFYLADNVIKYPLNEYKVETLVAHNASYFSSGRLAEVTGVTVTETATVKGDAAAGNSARAVWSEFDSVYDMTNHADVGYALQRLAFDRRTGALIKCCGEFVGTSDHTQFDVSGQAYSWPFNTQKRTYQIFDNTIYGPVPARYDGTATIDGLTTYKFVDQVPTTWLRSETFPRFLLGEKGQGSVTLGEYAQETVVNYVDPLTGGQVDTTADENLSFRDSGGATRLVLLQADFKMSPSTVQGLVNLAKSGETDIDLVTAIVPLIAGLAGIVLLVTGAILVSGRRGGGDAGLEPLYADQQEQVSAKEGGVT
jgi:hypothetical protein